MDVFEFMAGYRDENASVEIHYTLYSYEDYNTWLMKKEMEWADELGVECECYDD